MVFGIGDKGDNRESDVDINREALNLRKQEMMNDAAMYDSQSYMQEKEQRDELTRWQQDLNDELEKLYYGLLNYYKDENGDWKPKQLVVAGKDNKLHKVDMNPTVNLYGVSQIIELVRNYVSRNTMNSNLDDNIIRNVMISFGNALALNLAENYYEYALDMSLYHSMNVRIRHIVYFTLYRAFKDGERRHQETQRRMIEAYSQGEQKDPKKALALFGGK